MEPNLEKKLDNILKSEGHDVEIDLNTKSLVKKENKRIVTGDGRQLLNENI